MTNQLITLAKLDEEDKTRFPMEDFSINQVCHEAIDAFAPGFKKEGIKFSSHITGNLTMFGNRHLMEELVYLFLDNSLKYTGGENKSSYFVVNENKKNIEFRFSNTIDKDDEVDIKQIMERFYRSPSQKKDGSGIGLSIAKEIIDFHKGKIKIEKNENTLFFILSFHR
ncbi:sensor histidine kinase [Treponema rectale]|uniref:histidine kinase n=1 Tax=Treponema rectale TaxID=744512 RepID=A0A7M1XJF8_9SPIR|nr:sensor histidine kinase [Treponema rectale]